MVSFNVAEYPIKPISKRVANSNDLLGVSEVVDLHLQSINSSWDAFTDPIHSIDDISFDKVQEKKQLPPPVFENISDGFMVTVYSSLITGLGDKLGDKLGDNQQLILETIKGNPTISLSQLSKIIGISQTAIENNIAKLKKTGFLARIGPDKGGHWEILPHQ